MLYWIRRRKDGTGRPRFYSKEMKRRTVNVGCLYYVLPIDKPIDLFFCPLVSREELLEIRNRYTSEERVRQFSSIHKAAKPLSALIQKYLIRTSIKHKLKIVCTVNGAFLDPILNVQPQKRLKKCYENTRLQHTVDLLADGATVIELRRAVLGKFKRLKRSTIPQLLLDDVAATKGYGLRTEIIDNKKTYFLVLPEGYTEPLKPKKRKRHVKRKRVGGPQRRPRLSDLPILGKEPL